MAFPFFYRAFHRFRHAKLVHDGLACQKNDTSKGVKIDSKKSSSNVSLNP